MNFTDRYTHTHAHTHKSDVFLMILESYDLRCVCMCVFCALEVCVACG